MPRRRNEASNLLLAAIAATTGVMGAARLHETGPVAFTAQLFRPQISSLYDERDERSCLRPCSARGKTCQPARSPLTSAEDASGFPRPRPKRSRQTNGRPSVVAAASSRVQEPLERTTVEDSYDDESHRRRQQAIMESLQRHGRRRLLTGVGEGTAVDEEINNIYMPGGRGAGLRPGYDVAAIVRANKAKRLATAAARAAAMDDRIGTDTARSFYASGGGMEQGVRFGEVEAQQAAGNPSPVMWSKPVTGKSPPENGRFKVVLAGREDLEEAGALCIKVFFGEPDSPWKTVQLRQLMGEQRQDLESRCYQKESVMFKAVDTRRDDAMVGFIEVSETAGSKYGMGSDVPLADTRPVVSNLAVDPIARRSGIGTALMDACEDMVNTWDFEEIILQVEEDNKAALAFYGGMGFHSLFVDRAARRYDTSGFLLQNVRTSKITMRKVLSSSTASPKQNSGDSLGDHLTHLFGFLAKPFVSRPPPSTRRPITGPTSVENLFGPAGGDVDFRKTGRRVTTNGGKAGLTGPEQIEIPPVRLHRTRP